MFSNQITQKTFILQCKKTILLRTYFSQNLTFLWLLLTASCLGLFSHKFQWFVRYLEEENSEFWGEIPPYPLPGLEINNSGQADWGRLVGGGDPWDLPHQNGIFWKRSMYFAVVLFGSIPAFLWVLVAARQRIGRCCAYPGGVLELYKTTARKPGHLQIHILPQRRMSSLCSSIK